MSSINQINNSTQTNRLEQNFSDSFEATLASISDIVVEDKTATFLRNFENYTLVSYFGVITVLDANHVVLGKLDLSLINTLKFADQTISAGDIKEFDALAYIASYPDLIREFGLDAQAGVEHFIKSGHAQGRTITFDPLAYIASYPDLIETFGMDAKAGTEHYINFSLSQERNVTFDPLAYIASHPDLIEKFGTDAQAGVEHFIKSGHAQGRTVTFDPLAYIASHPELIEEFGADAQTGARHYIISGRNEGLTVTFDPLAYIASYPDLIREFGLDAKAGTEHFINDGGKREVTFDPLAYIASHRDLIFEFGEDAKAGTEHYIRFGHDQGREITFDPEAHLAAKPHLKDLKAATIDYINSVKSDNKSPTKIVAVGNNGNETLFVPVNSDESTFVATLSAIDEDENESFTYSLNDDAGDRFVLGGANNDEIHVAADSNFKDAPFYDIKVRVGDRGNRGHVETIRINVRNEAPNTIHLDNISSIKDAAPGTVVGRLSTNDPNTNDTFTYTLIDDADGRFKLGGENDDEIHIGAVLDFEDGEFYDIIVKVEDGGGLTHIETIRMNNEAPTAINLDGILSDDVQVNTTTANNQRSGVSTALIDGGYVSVWESWEQDGSAYGIFAQRYDEAGNKIDDEFLVNTTTLGSQSGPRITKLNDGGFVIVWTDNGVSGQRYDANGNKVDGEFRIDTVTTDHPVVEDIEALKNGGFVVSWRANGDVFSRIYDASGDAVGNRATVVNTIRTNTQRQSQIMALSDGGYIATWSSWNEDGSAYDIYLQRFDALGEKIGDETQVNTTTTSGRQEFSDITLLTDGSFVVTWQSQVQDGSVTDIYMQHFAIDGSPGEEIQVNTTSNGHQSNPNITALSDGGYIIVWQSKTEGGGYNVLAKRFDADGKDISSEFLINQTTDGEQSLPVVEALSNGDILFTWTENSGADGDQANIHQRIMKAPQTVTEDAAPGTVVGRLSTNDSNTNDSFTYTLIDDADGRFKLGGANSDEIHVAAGAKLEKNDVSYDIIVRVTDSGGLTRVETIRINVKHEVPTAIAINNNVIFKDEIVGTIVGQLSTADPDTGDHFTYTLTDDAGGRFKIGGENKDEIHIGDALDLENAGVHDIEVKVADRAGLTHTETIRIHVNPEAPTGVTLSKRWVREDDAITSTVVGTLSTTDPDTGDRFTYTLTDDAGGRFILGGENNDEIHMGAALDFEDAKFHDIEVKVTDAVGFTHTETIRIYVNPEAPISIALSQRVIQKDADIGAVVGRLSTTDLDTDDSFTYILIDDAGGRFVLGGENKDEILLARPLGSEAEEFHNIKVEVTDRAGLTVTRTIKIDVNAEAPTAIGLEQTWVKKEAPINTVVGRLRTEDPDGSFDKFTYTLTDDAGGRFILGEENNDEIQLAQPLDSEDAKFHDIEVKVTDAVGFTHTETIRIYVNPEESTRVALSQRVIQKEDTKTGAVVGRLSTTGPDIEDGFTYTLTDDAEGRFKIGGENSDEIQLARALNSEDADRYNITVEVTDRDGFLVQTSGFSIDVNPEAPTAIRLGQTWVKKDAPIGAFIAHLNTTDPDGFRDSFTYTLTDDAGGRFALDGANKNQIHLAQPLDSEDAKFHDIEVKVTDAVGFTHTETIRIYVNPEAPTSIALSQRVIQKEDTKTGAVVGRLSTIGPDIEDGFTYTLTDNAGGRFKIGGENSDEIQLARALNSEDAETYNIRVKVTDSDGFLVQTSSIDIDVNAEAPTAIRLDQTWVKKEAPINTVVGRLNTADPDGSLDKFTYTLINDAGGRFVLGGENKNEIQLAQPLHSEDAKFHDIEVKVTDAVGFTHTETIRIYVNPEESTRVALSQRVIQKEDTKTGAVVGRLSTTGPDIEDGFTYTLTNDAGGRFKIGGENSDEIQLARALNSEDADQYSIRVKVTDRDGFLVQTSSIDIQTPTAVGPPA